VRAFNGLDVLVARDEGLFTAEGLDLRIAPAVGDAPSTADGTLTKPVSVVEREAHARAAAGLMNRM
jgi:hypothetical protein